MRNRSFVDSLTDIRFDTFVTARLVPVLYVVSVVLLALVALAYVVTAFAVDAAVGVLVLLVAAPLALVVGVVWVRVVLELAVVLFRIGEHTADIKQALLDGQAPDAGGSVGGSEGDRRSRP